MMYRKPALLIPLFVVASLGLSSAFASTISLLPDSTNATYPPSSTVILDLQMDFSDDPTLGGGVDIFYNGSLLNFVSFEINPALGSDPSFTRAPDDLGNVLEGLVFGNFNGLSGPESVGTLTFTTLGTGIADFTIAETTDPLKGGGFFSAVTLTAQNPTFIGTSVNISAIPLPAAAWLFASGLLGLAGFSRRRKL
ncbi:MAG: VPLPA-CTERM sorting domain-containing protein [Methylococcales bacterium]